MKEPIATARLILRDLYEEDSFSIFQMRKHPLMHRYTDSIADTEEKQTLEYIRKIRAGEADSKWYLWAIEEKQAKKVIGTISIWNFNEERTRAELGFGLHPDFWGNGFMQETLKAIVDYGFVKLSLDTIEAYTEKENERSRRLLERSGFSITKAVEEAGYYDPKRIYQMIVYERKKQ